MDATQALTNVHQLLALMKTKGASDLFITSGFAPAIKLDGRMTPVTSQRLTPDDSRALVLSTMNDRQRAEFETTRECNYAISVEGIGRFRV
jgi:twitching motility protein PilU